MIWIVGEYAERIDNADELLEGFLDGFKDENTQVQLQLLTGIVKLFLKKPTETQELVTRVLTLVTQVFFVHFFFCSFKVKSFLTCRKPIILIYVIVVIFIGVYYQRTRKQPRKLF